MAWIIQFVHVANVMFNNMLMDDGLLIDVAYWGSQLNFKHSLHVMLIIYSTRYFFQALVILMESEV